MIRLIEPVNISDEYEKGYEDGYKVGRAEGAPKGRWIVKDFIPCCSVCGMPAFRRSNYCSECGARMIGSVE